MAEFQEVMREWTRMCNAVPGKTEHRNLCSNNESGYVCPLQENALCNLALAAQTNEDWAEGEHIIMSWAAAHPEPVYPTWREWLIKRGIISFEPDLHSLLHPEPTTVTNAVKAYLNEEGSKPIPADIAEKLGLQPKEE